MKRHTRALGGARLAFGLAAATGASLVFAPRVSYAQDAIVTDSAGEARSQYAQGTQSFQAKRYEEAALHFEAASSFRTSSVALYTAGLAWDLASKPERAADAYARALAVGGLDTKQTNIAKDRVAQLERTLGTVAVTAPEAWRVQLETFTEVLTPARLHAGAGVRSLSIRAPGRPIERRDVSLEAGKVTSLDLKDEPKAPPKPVADAGKATVVVAPPPTIVHESSYWIPRRVIGVGVSGVGAAVLFSTIVLGIQANGAKDAYVAGPTQKGYDHASSLETWTNVALVSGAVLVAGGVALVVIPDDEKRRVGVRVGPALGGAVLLGAF